MMCIFCRIKRFFTHHKEIWKLTNWESHAGYYYGEMDSRLFDKLTTNHIMIEIDGDRFTFMQTPIMPVLVYRKKRGRKKKRLFNV